MEANVFYLTFGLILGFAFVVLMCKFILPEADQIVKKNRGPLHAWVLTRFCCICVFLPLYVFSIWMIVAVAFDQDAGFEVIESICPDDYTCVDFWSFDAYIHDKDACTTASCSDEDLYARSGSQPIDVPYGLGVDLGPKEVKTVTYACDTMGANYCEAATSSDSEETCECSAGDDSLMVCTEWTGCFDDLEAVEVTTTCLDSNNTENKCTEWQTDTDSEKQFSFNTCTCTSNSTGACDAWSCEETTMRYYYPNVVFSLILTVMWFLPLVLVLFYQILTQMKKVCPCNDPDIYVHGQAAGFEVHTTAEDLRTGGFNVVDTERKQKYRTFSKKDVALYLFVIPAIVFFAWLIVRASGRVGIILIALALLGLFLYQGIKFACWFTKKNRRFEERKRQALHG